MPTTPLVKAGALRILAVLFIAIGAWNGYRIKAITMEQIGWDWSRGPGYIFSSDFHGNRWPLILGCYGSFVLAAILLFVSARMSRSGDASKR